MLRKSVITNQRGVTLFEILTALVIFMVLSVSLVSLTTYAIEKPRQAGIKNTLNAYENQAKLLLNSSEDVTDSIKLVEFLNADLDEDLMFDINGVSKIKNAYNKNYTVEIVQEGIKTAIVIETIGRNSEDGYKLVVVKDGGEVESCTNGFGRSDKNLSAIDSSLCDSGDTGGGDTEGVTIPEGYIAITNADELNAVRNNLSAKYILLNNIDLADSPHNNDTDGWSPLGEVLEEPFIGIFDGNDKTISNLKVKTTSDFAGLFGIVQNAEIKDLSLSNVSVEGVMATGALAGIAYDNVIIDNTHATGTVAVGQYSGGLVGSLWEGTITNSSSTVSVITEDPFSVGMGYSNTGGLVGSMDNSTIHGATTNSVVHGLMTGGIVGYARYSDITEVHTNSTVIAGFEGGGIVGNLRDSTMRDAEANGTVNSYVGGGLAGTTDLSTIENSKSSVAMTSYHNQASYSIGGAVGIMEETNLINVSSNGTINLTPHTNISHINVGGLVGSLGLSYSAGGTITNSHSSTPIALASYTGTRPTGVGGLIGTAFAGSVQKSYATGNITSTLDGVGGLIGISMTSADIKDTYSTSSVRGSTNVGGLIGKNGGTTKIENSYAKGLVTATKAVTPVSGGLVGVNTSTGAIVNSFYDSQTTTKSDTGKGVPKTTAQMKQKTTFTNWDFTTIWGIEEGTGYPTLN